MTTQEKKIILLEFFNEMCAIAGTKPFNPKKAMDKILAKYIKKMK